MLLNSRKLYNIILQRVNLLCWITAVEQLLQAHYSCSVFAFLLFSLSLSPSCFLSLIHVHLLKHTHTLETGDVCNPDLVVPRVVLAKYSLTELLRLCQNVDESSSHR